MQNIDIVTEPKAIAPRKTAILAMDYQASITGSLGGSMDFIDAARNAIDALREKGGRICYVRVAFEESDYDRFPAHSAMGARIKAARVDTSNVSPKTAVHAAIAPASGDIVVRKTRVGAFSTTDLDAQLKTLGVETLVLAGVHTGGVVLTTVREAHDLDYRVIVLSDACADPDQEVHDCLISKIFPRQSTVMTSAEFEAHLEIL
ncbi:cysteine hydrolase [Paraburkholderia panacisoli]|uniref:Cysteine hydrolase n=1 Tax=Paraburkholderia panacisoli TaxID=2603818 RepID=A0A5B0G6X6_9BURK|nr:cysteine hydrolase [Paraburkholderia panacisoli]KAA0999144.1 cysteine hydrolase [Paraburkholderia panacisoli]